MNQRENFLRAIENRKALIARCERQGRDLEKAHQERVVADLEAQIARMNQAKLSESVSIGANIAKLMKEARMTQEQLAAAVTGGDTKAVRGHIRGNRQMHESTKEVYEAVFSKKLGRKIRLS